MMKLLWVDEQAPPRDALASEAFVGLHWLHAATLAEAQALLERAPDVGLVVAELGLASGADAIKRLRESAPHATLIALSADERRGTVMGAISAGAAGFILKTADAGANAGVDARASAAALQIALAGGIPLPISLLERRAPDRPGYGTWTPTPRPPEALGFPPDEAAVLRLLVEGQPEALIARTLGLPEAGVKAHLASAFRRLGASSRSQAVLEAARLGVRFGPRQDAPGSRASSIASP